MTPKTKESQASSLVTDAYDYLVEAITSFKLPTNAPISENKLATQLGISRTPIRQALQRLESEGLITKSDSSRFSVALVTPKQVEEACDLLQIIDTYLFRKAAENLDKKGAAELISVTQQMICSKEHEVLAKAIVDKDFKALEPAVIAHMAHMRSSILRILETASNVLV